MSGTQTGTICAMVNFQTITATLYPKLEEKRFAEARPSRSSQLQSIEATDGLKKERESVIKDSSDIRYFHLKYV